MQKFSDFIYGRVESDCETNKPFKVLLAFYGLIGIKAKPHGFLPTLHMVFFCIAYAYTPFLAIVGFLRYQKTASATESLCALQGLINAIFAAAKSVAVLVNFKRFQSVEPIMKSLDERYKTPQERQHITDCVADCTRLYAAMGFIYYLYGHISIVTALIIHKQPFGGWYPFFDWISNPTVHFYSCLSFETWYVYFLITAQYLHDGYPTLYMRTIRAHMQLLRERIGRLGVDPDKSDDENNKELIDCIATHQQILQVVDIVRSVCSPTIFMQFVCVALVHCVCMINIFIFANTLNRVITIWYYLLVATQILPTCYEASTLEMESSKLPVAIFHCNWLALDKRGRKLILFFIHHAQKNITFVAMHLFEINMRTYLSIAKFSFTLYTFANEMRFGQNMKELVE
uniref:Odorant receptor n=1 Tax=Bactrocera latifrons TaxID=174628 RepID=A0A5H2WYS9_BACLA